MGKRKTAESFEQQEARANHAENLLNNLEQLFEQMEIQQETAEGNQLLASVLSLIPDDINNAFEEQYGSMLKSTHADQTYTNDLRIKFAKGVFAARSLKNLTFFLNFEYEPTVHESIEFLKNNSSLLK